MRSSAVYDCYRSRGSSAIVTCVDRTIRGPELCCTRPAATLSRRRTSWSVWPRPTVRAVLWCQGARIRGPASRFLLPVPYVKRPYQLALLAARGAPSPLWTHTSRDRHRQGLITGTFSLGARQQTTLLPSDDLRNILPPSVPPTLPDRLLRVRSRSHLPPDS